MVRTLLARASATLTGARVHRGWHILRGPRPNRSDRCGSLHGVRLDPRPRGGGGDARHSLRSRSVPLRRRLERERRSRNAERPFRLPVARGSARRAAHPDRAGDPNSARFISETRYYFPEYSSPSPEGAYPGRRPGDGVPLRASLGGRGCRARHVFVSCRVESRCSIPTPVCCLPGVGG